MKANAFKDWQFFVDDVREGRGGQIYTGSLKHPVRIMALESVSDEQKYAEAGMWHPCDRRKMMMLFGNAPRTLEFLKDAVNRLDKLTEDSTTARRWLDEMYAHIQSVETDPNPRVVSCEGQE